MSLRIFSCHGVIEKRTHPRLQRNFLLLKDFKEEIARLARGPVLSLEEAEAWLEGRSKTAAGTLITFDDGYANNLAAAEILAKFKMPWTVFVSAGCLEKGGVIWTVELSLLIFCGRAEKIGLNGRLWRLNDAKAREAAFQEIRYPMKKMPAEERRRVMDLIRSQFPAGESARLLAENPSFEMLSWAEVRQLASAGVTVASHGLYHEIHGDFQPASVRVEEINRSRVKIEAETGRPCRYFAFPNGDFCEQSADELRAEGYVLGLTTQPGIVQPGTNPYFLPRFELLQKTETA